MWVEDMIREPLDQTIGELIYRKQDTGNTEVFQVPLQHGSLLVRVFSRSLQPQLIPPPLDLLPVSRCDSLEPSALPSCSPAAEGWSRR